MISLINSTQNEKLQKLKIQKFIKQCLLIITLSCQCLRKIRMEMFLISQSQFKMKKVTSRKLSKKQLIMKSFKIFMFKFHVSIQNYLKTISYLQILQNNLKSQNFSFKWMEEHLTTGLKDQQTFQIFQFPSKQISFLNSSHLQKVRRRLSFKKFSKLSSKKLKESYLQS